MHKRKGSKPLVCKMLLLVLTGATATLDPVLIGLMNSSEGLAQIPVGISGTWKVTSTWGNAERHDQIGLLMLLRQNGNEITRSLGPSADNQPMVISNGKIDGNAVSFDVGYERAKLSIKFQLHGEKAQGEFSTINQQGITIQGTGTGQVRANQMTFEWSAIRNDGARLQGKLEFTKAEK